MNLYISQAAYHPALKEARPAKCIDNVFGDGKVGFWFLSKKSELIMVKADTPAAEMERVIYSFDGLKKKSAYEWLAECEKVQKEEELREQLEYVEVEVKADQEVEVDQVKTREKVQNFFDEIKALTDLELEEILKNCGDEIKQLNQFSMLIESEINLRKNK